MRGGWCVFLDNPDPLSDKPIFVSGPYKKRYLAEKKIREYKKLDTSRTYCSRLVRTAIQKRID